MPIKVEKVISSIKEFCYREDIAGALLLTRNLTLGKSIFDDVQHLAHYVSEHLGLSAHVHDYVVEEGAVTAFKALVMGEDGSLDTARTPTDFDLRAWATGALTLYHEELTFQFSEGSQDQLVT